MPPTQHSRYPEAPLETSGWRNLLMVPGVVLLWLDASRRILNSSAAIRETLAMARRALQGLPLAVIGAWRTASRIAGRVRGLLDAGYLHYGALRLGGGSGARRHFSFRRTGRVSEDSQVVACGSYAERMRAEDSGDSERPQTRRGVLDADAIEEAAERECARTRESGIALSMLRLNLDGAKLDAGAPMFSASEMSAASRDFARRLLGLLRAEDIVGQLDDQAFVVLLPGTTARGVLRVAERLRTAVAASEEGGAAGRGVTVSIGIVTTRTGRAPYRTLRARAEAKCEEASSSGGNRVAA